MTIIENNAGKNCFLDPLVITVSKQANLVVNIEW